MCSTILKIFPIVGVDSVIHYSECAPNAPKFSYMNKVFFALSLNIKYLCKYLFGIKQYLACYQKNLMCKIICKYRHNLMYVCSIRLNFFHNLQFVQSSTCGYAILPKKCECFLNSTLYQRNFDL